MEELAQLQARTIDRILATPIARGILSGNPVRDHYVGYLINVFHYASHSAHVIALAGSRCVADRPELASYLFRHAQEELGHERWALGDLGDLDVSASAVRGSRPSPSCLAMIGLEYFAAGHGNPVSLLGWMRVLESLGDELGHRIAAAVGSLGAPGRATHFLRGHGDADREHIKEIDRQVETHARAPADKRDLVLVARTSADLYVRMLEEISAGGVTWS